MIIGSHVSFREQQLKGSVLEAISCNANAFMFYTGAPQNTMRAPINMEYTKEAHRIMQENGINDEHVICHAPYIINLANNIDPIKYNFSISFLKGELTRCAELGVKYLVLHPGSSLKIDKLVALNNIIFALNNALENSKTMILLETMAGKGSECGIDINELKTIIDGVKQKDLIGVCLDTCHLNDSGIDLLLFDSYLEQFDHIIGIDKIKCVHLNDSKNICGSHKDRHENIGYGTIGFDILLKIANHEQLKDVPKILETPFVEINDKLSIAPYKEEINILKNGEFKDFKETYYI